MAANFQPQHMGGGGQMMPQQQPPQQQQQQQQQQQRQQLQGGANPQLQQLIIQALKAQIPPRTGWQTTVLIQERMSQILTLIGNLRLASQHQHTPPTLVRMAEIGVKYEKEIFDKSPDKARYKQELQQKMDQLLEKRTMNQPSLQQAITLQAQAQAQAQSQQMMMMNQNNMQGQVARPMDHQASQQGFHHLQRPMQATPIPGQQPQPMPVGMPSEGMPQNLGQNPQQFQMTMQQPQPPQNVHARPQNGQPQLGQGDAAMVQELTNRLMAQVSPEHKTQLRLELQTRMDPDTYQRYQSQGIDPVILYYRNQAVNRLRHEKQVRMAHAQHQGQLPVAGQPPPNVPVAAPPMQQQRSMNPSPLGGQTQPLTSGGGNQDFSFMSNMGNLIDQQQQQGMMAQEQGQVVVPASGAQRNATPQPGGAMPGQQMGMNDPRRAQNPNLRAQQQMFAQQQQQRMQHTAQQQSQAAVRANAQAKAQMSLQGQPGGMGPMPPQQSPAMGTLNTPLRTPSQQGNNPEPPQVNPHAQFGQALDPRFMQANQRQSGAQTALNAMLANIPPDQHQRLVTLPADKLNDLVNKWHEGRAANAQAGRPPMPMQANNQIRPGQQVPQPGQFNPNALNQFLVSNPGQRPPPALTAGMNPHQQQMLLQRMQQQNPLQQRNGPPTTQNEQRITMQMDNMEIPPALLNHQQMPHGIPPEVKKWGLLKQWAQANLPPEVMDTIKNLQRMHYQGLLHSRGQVPQPMGLPNGVQGNQVPGSMGPAGISAPVAPMGQNPMPMANGMDMGAGQLRQPTPQDIQAARNHPSGKMAGATDDQIRNLLMRNQMAQRQIQQKQAAMLQMQMANQMPQMDGQQPRPGVQPGPAQQGGNQMAPSQKAPQAKQIQPPVSEPAGPPQPTNARVARPTPAGRAAGQNSPPAPSKTLKRASSDDVVEVPNPNAPLPSAPQQNQGQKAPLQQPPRFSDQQIAALNPEDRKKYEQAQRMFHLSRGQQQVVEEQLRAIMQEEAQRRDPLPDIPMDQETKQTMVTLLRQIQVPLTNVGKAVPRWFHLTRDVARTRVFVRTRHRLQKQFKDPEMTQPRDTFSIQPSEVEQARAMLASMVKDLSDRFPKMKKPDGAQPQPQAASGSQAAQVAATATTPLNAANLQQQQQQLNKMHRAGSRTTQAPAAPTSSQPPFQLGAPSPHGGVKYGDTNPPITQENLHLPPRKKQRPNGNAQNTPGSNASPRTSKPLSPEVKRQQVPESKPKPSLSCPEPECERLQLSFTTQEALKSHTELEHVRPLADPAKYAFDKLASVLDWDSQSRVKKPEGTTPGGAKVATPNMKSESTPAGDNTPMNRQVSMSRQGTSNTKTPPDASKGALAEQKGSNQQPAQEADPWADFTIDPMSIFQNVAPESGALGAISDMNQYRSITPNDTPESSKDGLSEPNSDISEGVGLDISLDIFDEKWQPFSGSDADFLADMTSYNNPGEQDMAMVEDDSAAVFASWVDVAAFDKPFQFDNSLFSISAD